MKWLLTSRDATDTAWPAKSFEQFSASAMQDIYLSSVSAKQAQGTVTGLDAAVTAMTGDQTHLVSGLLL